MRESCKPLPSLPLEGGTMSKDDNDKLRAGELGDPFEGTEKYQTQSAPKASSESNEDAPLLSELYGITQLQSDRERELVSVAKLPGWPNCQNEAGHGWGAYLDRILGGGICPGYMLGTGASSAGAGKTAFVMQLVDGLALRNVQLIRDKQPGPLLPIVIASEMSPAALSWRGLARWTSRDARIFRSGKSAAQLLQGFELYPAKAAKEAWERAEEALLGEFGQARSWIRVYQGDHNGPNMIKQLDSILSQWVDTLQKQYPDRTIWPVVVIDPIQRYQAQGVEVEALNNLVECLGVAAINRGWVALITSDTNKPSASGNTNKGDKREEGAAAFRGSYKLQHLLDAAIYLTKPEDSDPKRPELELVIVKNRWGSAASPWPRYYWDVRYARFEPLSEKEIMERLASQRQEEKPKNNGKPKKEDHNA